MSQPTVAIVGRPNVGKSTLFNRILGGRDAIVSEHAGTTRDRHFGEAEWGGRGFWLVDTGGLLPDSKEAMDKAVRSQVELALAEADLILFLTDGKQGLHPVDQAVAEKVASRGGFGVGAMVDIHDPALAGSEAEDPVDADGQLGDAQDRGRVVDPLRLVSRLQGRALDLQHDNGPDRLHE